jgi:hypothetical protein
MKKIATELQQGNPAPVTVYGERKVQNQPVCQYCDEPLDHGGPVTNGLHEACRQKFDAELAAAFPEEIPPADPRAFDLREAQPEDGMLIMVMEAQAGDVPF